MVISILKEFGNSRLLKIVWQKSKCMFYQAETLEIGGCLLDINAISVLFHFATKDINLDRNISKNLKAFLEEICMDIYMYCVNSLNVYMFMSPIQKCLD